MATLLGVGARTNYTGSIDDIGVQQTMTMPLTGNSPSSIPSVTGSTFPSRVFGSSLKPKFGTSNLSLD